MCARAWQPGSAADSAGGKRSFEGVQAPRGVQLLNSCHPTLARSWAHHLQDWEAAVEWVAGGGLGPGVDGSRIALWGTSYSGGHVSRPTTRPWSAMHRGRGVMHGAADPY